MMFNPKQFENKVYELVTQEVNEAFSKLLKKDWRTTQTEGIEIQKQVIRALHFITEETVMQTLCGLLANKQGRQPHEKSNP